MGGRPAPLLGRFTLGEGTPIICYIAGWVGLPQPAWKL